METILYNTHTHIYVLVASKHNKMLEPNNSGTF